MQRRRRPKATPKDIFGTGSQTKSTKKEGPRPRKAPSSVSNPVPTPPPTVGIKPEPLPAIEDRIASPPATAPESAPVEEDVSVLKDQILGVPKRKSIGLRPVAESKPEESLQTIVSTKAQELIDESKHRAVQSEETEITESEDTKISEELVKPKPVISRKLPPPKPVSRKPRRRQSSFQPAKRAKRLDRSRHMEYKYEVRRVLEEIGVSEEHRSSLLGSIWAKGERQTVSDAKQYLEEKLSEGIINEVHLSRLCEVIDSYTVRR